MKKIFVVGEPYIIMFDGEVLWPEVGEVITFLETPKKIYVGGFGAQSKTKNESAYIPSGRSAKVILQADARIPGQARWKIELY